MAKIDFDFKNLSPFKWFVLENFPFIEADFDALTEWQLFCKIGKEINKIIDSQNLVGEQTEQIVTAFNNLYDYVYNFFANLDVQEEINNKLNEMAESGELTEILTNFLNLNPSIYFNNIDDFKNATFISNGMLVKTKGYYNINDGGSAFYIVTNDTENFVPNDIDIIELQNNLVGYLINTKESINILQLGCKGDNTFDNTTRIQHGIDKYNNIYIPVGKFLISDTLIYKRYTKIIGANKLESIIIMSPTVEKAVLESYNFNNFKDNPSPYWQWNENTICFFEFRNFRIDGNYKNSENMILKNLGNGINNYGASYIIDNVYIDNCAGVGFFNQWINPTYDQTFFRAGNQIAKIDIDINNCGEEALINDLGDSTFSRLFVGACGIKGISNYKNTNYCHSVILNKGCEAGEWHIYGNSKGYGIEILNSSRFRCNSLIVESCCGGIITDTTGSTIQIGNLHLHNMIYENANYDDEFYYIHQKNSLLFDVSNCIIREYNTSLDLALIKIDGTRMSLNNCYLSQTTDKTKPSIDATNTSAGRYNIEGLCINGGLVFKGKLGNACSLKLRIINYNLVVSDDFTIGSGSFAEFLGTLYENQKFSENLIAHPLANSFKMNMVINNVRFQYPRTNNSNNTRFINRKHK